jgi:hypothetical protein
MDGMPTDPVSLLAAAATQTHEMFVSYMNAGFTEPQALYLVGQMITASMRSGGAS